MKFASMEFVAFDTQDVIATSGKMTYFFQPKYMDDYDCTYQRDSDYGFYFNGNRRLLLRYADGTRLSWQDWSPYNYYTLVPSANNSAVSNFEVYVCTEVGKSAPVGATEYKDFADILNWVKNINQ